MRVQPWYHLSRPDAIATAPRYENDVAATLIGNDELTRIRAPKLHLGEKYFALLSNNEEIQTC